MPCQPSRGVGVTEHHKANGKPLKGMRSAQLRRATYEDRLRGAQDPLERVEVAFDYLRSAFVRAVTGHDLSDIEAAMQRKAVEVERDTLAEAQRKYLTWKATS